MSRTCDFAANWARSDAEKIGNTVVARSLTPEERAEREKTNNPTGLELPEGWRWDRDIRRFVWSGNGIEVECRWAVSDGYYRFEFTRGTMGSGHGTAENPRYFLRQLRWVSETLVPQYVEGKSDGQTSTGEPK